MWDDRSIDDRSIYIFEGLDPKKENKFYWKSENEGESVC